MKGSNNIAGVVVMHIVLAFFLLIGVACLFAPRTVQRIALRQRGYVFGFRNPLTDWMKTEGYVVYLRAMGLIFLIFVMVVEMAVAGFFP
jgi:uncharacterized membrane protein YjgN (DUF898 family)